MKLHVHDIIDHGEKTKTYCGSLDHLKHGSNYIASLIVKYVQQQLATISPDKFPHTLYLQVDNCWKENKNKTIFAVIGMLILSG